MYYLVREIYEVKAFNGKRETSSIKQYFGNGLEYNKGDEGYSCYNCDTIHPAIKKEDDCEIISYDCWDVKDIIAFSDKKIPKSKFMNLEREYKKNNGYVIYE